jgi:hypothetical protein
LDTDNGRKMTTKMIGTLLTSLSLCFHFSVTVAHAEMDAGEFLRNYDGGDNTTRRMFRSYLLGVSSGLGWADTYSQEVRKQTPFLCLPGAKVYSGEELIDLLRQEVADHSHSGKSPTGLALFAALRRLHTCRSGT